MEKTDREKTDPRIDKWLWAVRLFKTRSKSAEACRKGRVLIDGQAVKPSRHVREGDIISLRRPPAVFTYRVRGLVENRQPASNVNNYLEDLTSGEERQKALHQNIVVFSRRDRGSGRPTKKERRIIDKLKGPDK
jgi:ribosome-associated heat shock protein Hsp15